MVKEFVKAWEDHKGELEEAIKNSTDHNRWGYEDLVKMLFDVVINPGIKESTGCCFINTYDTSKMTVIDDGDYHGTLVFVIPRDTYQPDADDYVYTSVYYGSCSGCDTLQGIQGWSDELPNESQVKDYMSLCLHLLQHCHRMVYGCDREVVDYNTINMRVGELKEILENCPDDMPVVIPVITEDDSNCMLAFRHVRTAGILEDEYGEGVNKTCLCLNASENGADIATQVELRRSDITCKRVMF